MIQAAEKPTTAIRFNHDVLEAHQLECCNANSSRKKYDSTAQASADTGVISRISALPSRLISCGRGSLATRAYSKQNILAAVQYGKDAE